MKGSQKPHVVLLPFPAMGHSIPFLDLARLLALNGAAVSCVTTGANASRLEGAMAESQSAGLDIRSVLLTTPAVEGLPEGRESADVLPPELIDLLFSFAEKLAEPFERWLHQQLQQEQEETGRSPPVCIISDIMMPWTIQIGEKYGVPRVLFNTCGAFAMTLLYSVSASLTHNTLQKEGDSVVLSMNLPIPLRLNKNEIAANFFEPDMSNRRQRFVVRSLQSLSHGWGMLINTFEDLEPQHLSHFRSLTGKPIWSIGPVLPPNFAGKAGRGKMADISEDELVQWLDSQGPRSVLYVSFGSQTFLSERQTVALARGLEASEQPFVWAIKVAPKLESATTSDMPGTDADIQDYLPYGFEDRMKNKGLGLMIWGWAPQLLILSHQSVGAFMTHSGWNSTLESITLGVPLITWPMFGDQHFNSKQVAEQFRTGVQFCQHKDGIPEEERVKEVVRFVLTEDEGQKMRNCAEKLKEMASKAVREGGSSQTNLQAFVSDMQKLTIMRSHNSEKQIGDT
uniref:Glycosyltransferase n=1 Tax=Picea sitchensis TaxID=3332 RepID=A9NWC5_PICSI|nr:unknown [Picea sitchensis]